MLKKNIILTVGIFSLFYFFPTAVSAQTATDKADVYLSISPYLKVSIDGTATDNLWSIDKIIYGIPQISQEVLNISITTNLTPSVLYLETSTLSGNLVNEKQKELAVSYLLSNATSPVPNVLDPRWKPGNRIREFVQVVNSNENNHWKLFTRIFADSTCSFGTYRDVLTVVIQDKQGKKYKQKVGIQAVLNEESLKDRLKSEKYKPALAASQESVNFQFTENEFTVNFQNKSGSGELIAKIPVNVFVAQNILPAVFRIAFERGRHDFQDQQDADISTRYYLAETGVQMNDISPRDWESGRRLAEMTVPVQKSGVHGWNLYVKISASTLAAQYSNFLKFIIVDAKGNPYTKIIKVNLK